jgi:hypothetical protein
MTAIMKVSWTGHTDKETVVFASGIRIIRSWIIDRWRPLILAMTGMTRALEQEPKRAYLGSQGWVGRTTAIIQYCRSFEALATNAWARHRKHVAALAVLNRKIDKDDRVGINYGSYRIAPGWFANAFFHLTASMLGNCTTLIESKGKLAAAARPMGRLVGDQNAGLNMSGRKAVKDNLRSRARPLEGSQR